MAGRKRQQQQAAGCVIGDHRGVGHVEQFEAVEQQPCQRRGRPVCSWRQRPWVRSQGEVDRDAAVAILERGDDVTPQIAVRERPGEEDERRPLAGRSVRQGSKTGFQLFAFHAYQTYSRYVSSARCVVAKAKVPGR
jgi:hypothetical protein